MRRIVGGLVLLLMALWACDDSSTDLPACELQKISSDLTRVMYWGRVSAVHDEPNKGTPVGDIRLPLWHADNRIFVATQRLDHGTLVSGIFDITIDASSNRYVSLSPLKFPNLIWAYEYLPDSADFLITYPTAPNQPQLVRAHVAGDELQVTETLYDSTWLPASAHALDDGSGAVIYFGGGVGRAPGFYLVSFSTATSDSLVLAESVPYWDGLSFDIAGSRLYYGTTIGSASASRTLVFQKDLNGGLPTVIADLTGIFSGLAVSPDETCVLVARFKHSDGKSTPGSSMSIIDIASGQTASVDVRTQPCGFITASYPSWSPDGTRFAFIGNHFSGEGGESPLELWARRHATCP